MPARRLPTQPAQRASRMRKARDNARTVAVIWDMHVFINQLIECETSFKPNFYMDWNFEFLFCYLAAWPEVEQNKCKHDPQLSYYNKVRDLFDEMNVKDVCCERVVNQDVAALSIYLFLITELSAFRL